ncbi:GntR family transcriptional regulator [Brevundimonas sp. AJA228-03]|uniref:GntR family transcriptional regulator n=1 Tax=Brevundimonas sp. AJA228-03 TaxID=2752515 RepID=UPI001ADF2805|nr:GntR family transcriptional regulator [Brevundimonas sp. AJA228-03]QTN20872.1 GntR family transcriptional regulator [Brevundimonas sp. AJA228-03]
MKGAKETVSKACGKAQTTCGLLTKPVDFSFDPRPPSDARDDPPCQRFPERGDSGDGRRDVVKTRDPYHLALTALAQFAGAGRFGWGMPLVTTAVAEELGLSPTPVREALARLAGEGIIEHRPGRGYFAPSPSSSDIIELYELHGRLANWALIGCGSSLVWPLAEKAGAPQERLERLFVQLVEASGNGALIRAHRRTVAQLRPIRVVEERVAPLSSEVVDRMEGLLSQARLDHLIPLVETYHSERSEHAQPVFAMMRKSAESIDQI